MLAVNQFLDPLSDSPESALLEFTAARSRSIAQKQVIAIRQFDYHIRFQSLQDLSTHIYQTLKDGTLAFLVVVSSADEGEAKSAKKSKNFATSSKPSPLHGENQAFESLRAHLSFCNRLH
jgi:hypothetical protein